MGKMWDGRFIKELNEDVNSFNSSIKVDNRLFFVDIKGSIAHVKMLGKTKIISLDESNVIIDELKKIKEDYVSGKLKIDYNAEDIHMFIEEELTKRIGDIGKKIHTSRSRNDQVALDIRLYIIDEIKQISKLLKELIEEIIIISKDNLYTIMPGYTHLQRAQPVTYANYILAYANMFYRDIERLNDCFRRANYMPLGACALAGTTYNIDRDFVKDLLGFSNITSNSIDSVSDRDFCIELLSDISIIEMHLTRFCEEIILWSSMEFNYIEIDDDFATGSSIMPQKKNPDIPELIRGKSGKIFGNLHAMLTVMKGLPLAYNKDMQEDKSIVFESIDTIKECLNIFTLLLNHIKINKKRMMDAARNGFINATDCADYLVKKGLPFRDAYKIVGTIIKYCNKNIANLESLSIDKYKEFSELFDTDIYENINLKTCTFKRTSDGGSSIDSVLKQIKNLEKSLNNI